MFPCVTLTNEGPEIGKCAAMWILLALGLMDMLSSSFAKQLFAHEFLHFIPRRYKLVVWAILETRILEYFLYIIEVECQSGN